MATNKHAIQVHEFLLSPSAYPEKPKQVELKETHISWVYLTDRYVYKQKKPVHFEFLNFSTLERRKQLCEQEVELNRRFSPEVYIDVVPVSVTTGGYQLKRGANVVEWLVRMKKLDESKTLENLIHSDQLTSAHIKSLSTRLTDFYSAQAPAMLRSHDFLQSLRKHILANRNDLLIGLPELEATIHFVTNAQLRCLSLEADYFVQRVADGRVVDGHGDLRPEHVYFRRGQPAIIDCIEFSTEYRTNDVIDELSFLGMECDRLGNHEVGEAIMSDYFAASVDDPKPFLAAFYKCYRACVRAKVAALRATQAKGTEQTMAKQLARDYLELGKNYAKEIGPKLVLMVGGLSGSGKSTLASAIRDSLSAELLQTDVIRKELVAPNSPNGKYTREGRKRVYDRMASRMGSAFERSPTLVLDGTFNIAAARERVAEQAKSLGAILLQVECECPADVAAERIAHRLKEQNDASEATPELLAAQKREREQVLIGEPTLVLDTTMELAELLNEAMTFVQSIGPGEFAGFGGRKEGNN